MVKMFQIVLEVIYNNSCIFYLCIHILQQYINVIYYACVYSQYSYIFLNYIYASLNGSNGFFFLPELLSITKRPPRGPLNTLRPFLSTFPVKGYLPLSRRFFSLFSWQGTLEPLDEITNLPPLFAGRRYSKTRGRP